MSSSCYFPAKSVEQMTVEQLFVCTQKMKLLEKPQKSHFEQMQFLDQNDQLLELQLLDKNIEKCQLLEFKKVESLEHVRHFG